VSPYRQPDPAARRRVTGWRRLGSRLFGVGAAALAATAVLAVAPAVAEAAPIGGLTVSPGKSIDTAPIRLHTSGGCPAQADSFYVSVKGHGFPATGQVVTTPTAAGMSHRAGFDAFFVQTMKDFADDNHTTLQGQYDVTLFCIDAFTQNSFGEFTGSLQYTTPKSYEAIGAAMPSPQSTPSAPAVAAIPDAAVPSAAPPGNSPPAAAAAPRTTGVPKATTQRSSGGLGLPLLWITVALVVVLSAFEGGRRVGLHTAATTADPGATSRPATNRTTGKRR
jgi:hypothetical protein